MELIVISAWGDINISELKELENKLQKLANQNNIDRFCEDCAKELAARFLAAVINRTPVRETVYAERIVKDSNGKRVKYKRNTKNHKIGEWKRKKRKISGTGGTLRRGWTVETEQAAKSENSIGIPTYVESLRVRKVGRRYEIILINPVSYASYVEYGHRKRGGKGWTPGRFFMTKTELEMAGKTHAIVQKRFEDYLRKCLNV